MLTPCLLMACRSVPCAGSELLRTLQVVLWAVFLGAHALHPFSNIFTGSQYTSTQSIYKLLPVMFSVLNTNTAPIYLRYLPKENDRRTLRSNSSAVKLDVVRTIRKTGGLSVPRHDGIRSLLNYISVTLWHPLSASSRRTSLMTSLI